VFHEGLQLLYAEPKGCCRWKNKRDNHAEQEKPMNLCSGKNPGNEEGDRTKEDQKDSLN
jgi:hypothetical protein